MPLAKTIVTEQTVAGQGTPDSHTYYPLSAIMKQQGTKKPDTLEVILPIQNEVDENYEISYIQDVVNTEYLSAVYPMQLSCLDEGGYNQDPTDPAESRFVKVDIDKFKGHYALQFTADGQKVEVPSAKTNKIDLSKQFDINIWFTPDITQLQDGSDEPILWSFRNGVGLDIGIAGTNGNNSSWRVFLRVDKGSLIDVYTGSSELIMNTVTDQSTTRNLPCHIRVKRGSDNLLKAFVNGVEDISQTVTQDLQPSGTAMVFGDTEDSTDDEYKGLIHEVKVYCGSTLSDVDATKVRVTKPIVQYMKFNGRIVKVTDKMAAKRVICESNSYNLTKAKLGTSYSGTLTKHDLSSVAFKTIAQSAINNSSVTSGTFTVRNKDNFVSVPTATALQGYIYEIGSVVEFLQILLLFSECVMYYTPRKNVIIETNAGHTTGYLKDLNASNQYLFTFDQNSTTNPYNITTSEVDDSKVINEVILVGRGNVTDKRNITPTDGIRRTLRKVVKQLDNQIDITDLGYKFLTDLGGFGGSADKLGKGKQKYVIKSSAPIHHLRFNHKVKVKRRNGNNSNVSGVTDKDLDENIIVTQVKWNYPSGTTTINVGEYDIDFYEDMVKIGKSSDNLTDANLN